MGFLVVISADAVIVREFLLVLVEHTVMTTEQQLAIGIRQHIVREILKAYVLHLIAILVHNLIHSLSHGHPHTLRRYEHIRQHNGYVQRLRYVGYKVETILNLIIMVDAACIVEHVCLIVVADGMCEPHHAPCKTAIHTSLAQGIVAHHGTIRSIHPVFRSPPHGIILRLIKRIHPLARQSVLCAKMQEGEILHAEGGSSDCKEQ